MAETDIPLLRFEHRPALDCPSWYAAAFRDARVTDVTTQPAVALVGAIRHHEQVAIGEISKIEDRVPGWCVPPAHAVQEAWASLGRRITLTIRDTGVLEALSWIGQGDTSPLSNKVGRGRDEARAESWLALCLAAGEAPPTHRDWERLGVEPRPLDPAFSASAEDREYPFGVWRTLSWLLGVREDWPVYTGWHLAADLPNPHPHHFVPPLRRDTAWHAADAAAREQAHAEAHRWWAHVRRLADRCA